MLTPLSTDRGGLSSNQETVVGTLLLGGKSRTELSVPAKADRTVASSGTSPRIHVVRLRHKSAAPVASVTTLHTRAS